MQYLRLPVLLVVFVSAVLVPLSLPLPWVQGLAIGYAIVGVFLFLAKTGAKQQRNILASFCKEFLPPAQVEGIVETRLIMKAEEISSYCRRSITLQNEGLKALGLSIPKDEMEREVLFTKTQGNISYEIRNCQNLFYYLYDIAFNLGPILYGDAFVLVRKPRGWKEYLKRV